jgi:hypothetical protein
MRLSCSWQLQQRRTSKLQTQTAIATNYLAVATRISLLLVATAMFVIA